MSQAITMVVPSTTSTFSMVWNGKVKTPPIVPASATPFGSAMSSRSTWAIFLTTPFASAWAVSIR